MPIGTVNYLPRRLDQAWSRAAFGGGSGLKALVSSIPGNPAYSNWFDDYLGDVIADQYQADVGTGTQVIAVTNTLRNGQLVLTTGGTSGNSSGQAFAYAWRGTEGIYYHARAKLDTLTTAGFTIGLTDSGGNVDTGPIATKATPTFNATDCAVFAYDTNDDTNVTFITANAGVVGANADISTANAGLAAATWFTVEIVVKGGFASGWFNGQYVGGGAITSTAALGPMAWVMTRTTGTRALNVDYQGVVSPRSLT